MKSTLKTKFAISLVALLTACGGGGGGGGGGGDPATATVGKYAGTHSYCDRDHTRFRLTLTGTEGENYNLTRTMISYQNANCTGDVLGTYSVSSPSTLTFVETAIATVSVPNLASSLSIDKYKLKTGPTTGTLVGPGVDGPCVNITSNQQICFEMTMDAQELDLGFYLTTGGFYLMELENGIYGTEQESLLVKE